MAPNQDDSFAAYRRPDAPFLQPTSDSFGEFDARSLERSFLASAGRLASDLIHLADGARSGSLSVPRFVVTARAVIRREYFIAYSLGAMSIFPFYTMTDRDVMVLDAELEEETGFLRSFGADLRNSRLSLDPVSRTGLYLLALRGIFERGRVEAMPAGAYRWRLGNTEHCRECYQAALEGPYQRTRTDGLGLPVLPGTPGDGSVCLGLTRCGCRLELASGSPLPNEELADRLRGLLSEVVDGSVSVANSS